MFLSACETTGLQKNVANLKYNADGVIQIALQNDLKILHGLEIDSLVKLSKLNDVAISPKIVERQLVSTCLWVFCDKRITALETNTGTDKDSAMRTINFLKYWKIVNVIGVSADIEFNYQ